MPNPIGRALRNNRAGQDALIWALPGLNAPQTLTVTSPAFAPGEPIPREYRGRLFGPNPSPELEWTQAPAGTVELVLIVQDPDAPRRQPATHLVTRGIGPELRGVPEGGLAQPSPIPGLVHGKGALGHRGWAGPMPVPSHGPHVYVFQLFALDRRLDLPDPFTLRQAVDAMSGHVIARGRLDGTYEIP
ncbi:YbhB/YbcL family Raf kinase inhibitor-like protein [Planctomonas sp. JC2975]|uniref:YbhB/YbcL family Raf kinase inhibitor-like protein n=1 Tax=Planctomonas sp. JC2975 TaxID=2729626 RepID=UPI0014748CF6|nr:YbhB/YbcL family Raf kinase inhibitor-like protein [Planctomonas sp. JC2975]NNC13721.1 YbhB/YbcL family Raf kinase inhibitor-like protein [Planctomonas sp. JC2975]